MMIQEQVMNNNNAAIMHLIIRSVSMTKDNDE